MKTDPIKHHKLNLTLKMFSFTYVGYLYYRIVALHLQYSDLFNELHDELYIAIMSLTSTLAGVCSNKQQQ